MEPDPMTTKIIRITTPTPWGWIQESHPGPWKRVTRPERLRTRIRVAWNQARLRSRRGRRR